MRLVWGLVMLWLLSSCRVMTAPTVVESALPLGSAGTREWRAARARLRTLRQAYVPKEPVTTNVKMTMALHGGAGSMVARGAVAVHPHGSLRMIMLGPGGTTAFDLWTCHKEFRLAIPAADLVTRGDESTPPEQLRGLPVDFLRWWFLRPMSGRLLSFLPEDDEGWWRFVLRDGASVVDVRGRGSVEAPSALKVARRGQAQEEEVQTDGRVCGQVRYRQRAMAVELEIACEGRSSEAPPARAFRDPDSRSGKCRDLLRSGMGSDG